MKTAIITGVTGQDGALLAELLLRHSYKVIGVIPSHRETSIVRLQYLDILSKIQLVKLDLLNPKAVETFLEENPAQEFYNLAALSSVGLSFKEPLNTFEFNTRSVLNILEGIRKISPKTRFYQASSSEMFGNVGYSKLPIRESFLFHPASPYGISKASAHWLTVNYREAYKLQTCCGILFNHESALRPSHFVIKKIIRTALNIKAGIAEPLTLGNLAIVRDWGYAPAYVEAMWKMMQMDKMDDYLICSGNPISLNSFVQHVFAKFDIDLMNCLRIDTSLFRSLDLEVIYGDNSKARTELNWNYSMTPGELISRLIADEEKLAAWEKEKGVSL
jgi:GDPmannose 4,6-dehydratase